MKVGAEITEERHHPSLGLARKTVICSFCRLWASDGIKKICERHSGLVDEVAHA